MYLSLVSFLSVWHCTHVKADGINARVTSMLSAISSMFFLDSATISLVASHLGDTHTADKSISSFTQYNHVIKAMS